jgi:hypothetical protein
LKEIEGEREQNRWRRRAEGTPSEARAPVCDTSNRHWLDWFDWHPTLIKHRGKAREINEEFQECGDLMVSRGAGLMRLLASTGLNWKNAAAGRLTWSAMQTAEPVTVTAKLRTDEMEGKNRFGHGFKILKAFRHKALEGILRRFRSISIHVMVPTILTFTICHLIAHCSGQH